VVAHTSKRKIIRPPVPYLYEQILYSPGTDFICCRCLLRVANKPGLTEINGVQLC
jgi:hypothetical protein